jgi:hypothetical protein
MKDFPLKPARDDDFGDEELGAVPIVLGLMLDFFPDADTKRALRGGVGGRRGQSGEEPGAESRVQERVRRVQERGRTETANGPRAERQPERHWEHGQRCQFCKLLNTRLFGPVAPMSSSPFRTAEKKYKTRTPLLDLDLVFDPAHVVPHRPVVTFPNIPGAPSYVPPRMSTRSSAQA